MKKKNTDMADGLRESVAEIKGYLARSLDGPSLIEAIRREHPDRVHTRERPHVAGRFHPLEIAELRGRLGLSQAGFAVAVGVSRILVQSWERGVRKPSPLACRLLEIIWRDPEAYMASIALAPAVANPAKPRRAG